VTSEFAAAAAARPIGDLENAWSTDPRVLRRARVLGLPGWAFYLAGRGGVLGDEVSIETLAAALGLVAPEALRDGWQAAQRVGPSTVAAARLAECARWGSHDLGGVADARLTQLLDGVVEGADATALPVFAATRAMVVATLADVPAVLAGCPGGTAGEDGARVALLVHALAEYRASALLISCRAVGLRPVETLIAGPEGEQWAVTLGWAPPFPPRLAVLRRYAAANSMTDRITGGAYATLDQAERAELVDRLRAAATVAGQARAG
jgi:hypothetical protein